MVEGYVRHKVPAQIQSVFRRSVEKLALFGDCHGGRPIAHAELGIDVAQMEFHRWFRHIE